MSYLQLYFGVTDLTKIPPRLFLGFFNTFGTSEEALEVFSRLKRVYGVKGIDSSLFIYLAENAKYPLNKMSLKELQRRRVSPTTIKRIESLIKKEDALKKAKRLTSNSR